MLGCNGGQSKGPHVAHWWISCSLQEHNQYKFKTNNIIQLLTPSSLETLQILQVYFSSTNQYIPEQTFSFLNINKSRKGLG